MPAREELLFVVEEMRLDGSGVAEVHARAHLMSVAFAAFWAVVADRPDQRIALRKQAWEIRVHEPVAARPPAARSGDQ